MASDQRHRAVLMFGAPGSGKGTQGKILGSVPGFHHVSSGDIFRTLDVDSEMGKKFKEFASRGELVPDDLTIEIFCKSIEDQTHQGLFRPQRELLILDGIPRTVNQAQIMDAHIEVLSVIHLVFSNPEVMVERLRGRALKENRADDAREEVIRRRWEVYQEETRPLLDHFRAEIIADIDGVRSPALILQDILAVLAPLQDATFGNALA